MPLAPVIQYVDADEPDNSGVALTVPEWTLI